MSAQLLPASAAAFAPRSSSVNVVLGSKVEPWLTQTLRRIIKKRRPLNNVQQHQRCLTDALSSKNAIWVLASMMLEQELGAELESDEDSLMEATSDFQLVHVEAYVVHVDMVLRNEVAFKLTPASIQKLIRYHQDVHCVKASATEPAWPEKEDQIKRLQQDFVQAINKFVYRTDAVALEGLEEDGMGELLMGKSEEVKTLITCLFLPLTRPVPRVVSPTSHQVSSLPIHGVDCWPSTSQYCMPVSEAPTCWSYLPVQSNASSYANYWWPDMELNMSHQYQMLESPSHSQTYHSANMPHNVMPMISLPSQLPLPSTYTSHSSGYPSQDHGYDASVWNRQQQYAMT